MTIEVGAEAPSFRLPSGDGRPRSLADLTAEGPALLAFFKTSCPVCRMAFPVYGELGRRFGDVVPVVAVGQDPMLRVLPWLAENDFDGPALDDASDRFAVSSAYDLDTVPTAVLVGADGKVADVVIGWKRDGVNRLAAALGELTGRPGDPVSAVDDGRPATKPG